MSRWHRQFSIISNIKIHTFTHLLSKSIKQHPKSNSKSEFFEFSSFAWNLKLDEIWNLAENYLRLCLSWTVIYQFGIIYILDMHENIKNEHQTISPSFQAQDFNQEKIFKVNNLILEKINHYFWSLLLNIRLVPFLGFIIMRKMWEKTTFPKKWLLLPMNSPFCDICDNY